MLDKSNFLNRSSILTLVVLVILLLGACSTANSPNSTIEDYLHALADKNEVSAVNLSCGEWEEQALAEGASFMNVDVVLESVVCQVEEESDDKASVSCSGRFVFSYDAGEDQELNLEGRVFKVVKEASEWRMCGY